MKLALPALALVAGVAQGFMANAAAGAVTDEQVRQLIERIDAQDRRIAELEQALGKATRKDQPERPASVEPPAGTWTDRTTVQADMRLRQENIDAEGRDYVSRQRARARASVTARVDDQVEVGLGLATSGGSPVSTYFTLGDGFSTKDIDLDLAYVDWAPARGMHLTAGKMLNPFHRPGGNGLIWDSDLRPEGASIRYDNGRFFMASAAMTPAGNAGGSSTHMYGAQLGGRLPLADPMVLTIGAGYFDLGELRGRPLLFTPDDPRGNSTATGPGGGLVYATGYREAEVFAELATRLGRMPVSVFVDYVNNAAADEFDTGWAAGFTLGDAVKKGSWEFSYVYEDLEADAVVGLFADSDFGGGGTDARGHILGAAYALTDRIGLELAYLMNRTDGNRGEARRYDRLKLDLYLRY